MEISKSAVIEWLNPNLLKPHPLNLQIYGQDGYQD